MEGQGDVSDQQSQRISTDTSLSVSSSPSGQSAAEAARFLKVAVHNVREEENVTDCLHSLLGRQFTLINQEVHSTLKDCVEVQLTPDCSTLRSSSISGLHSKLDELWCQRSSHLWLRILDRQPSTEKSLRAPLHQIPAYRVSMGSLPLPDKYVLHWESDLYRIPDERKARADFRRRESNQRNSGRYKDQNPLPTMKVFFRHDMDAVWLMYLETARILWKMEMAYDSLEKFILMTVTKSSNIQFYLFLRNQPKLYRRTDANEISFSALNPDDHPEDSPEPEPNSKRVNKFGQCPTGILGSSSVLRLELPRGHVDMPDLLSRLENLGFKVMIGCPETEKAKSRIPDPQFEDFELEYAWFCLVSRGFKVTDQLTKQFVNYLSDQQKDVLLKSVLAAVTNVFDAGGIHDLRSVFHSEYQKRSTRSSHSDKEELECLVLTHMVKIRTVTLTPTTIYGLGAEWMPENRIIRQSKADRFLKLVIRDEDFQRLTASHDPCASPIERIVRTLQDGVQIGERNYRFLGCSNSQLRSHGVWLYASEFGETAESMRNSMGDFSRERCVASYLARLGQCFSSSKKTAEVENAEVIEDIEIKEPKYFCFTDGIGKISLPLAKKVSVALGLRYVPSAFQIRYGGCKGVLALAPDLGESERIQIRASMEKFKSEHKDLEILETAKPERLHLNRQVIMLMCGLEIQEKAFFSLQERMLQRIADILIDEEEAANALLETNLNMTLDALTSSEVCLTVEPFLRSVLLIIYRKKLEELLRKTRIEIPDDKGRIMMGTVDETNTLNSGEVFLQYSKDIGRPHETKQVRTGCVVVTKNPCFHPGDLRKFHAIGACPQLSHMVDCIVFPAKGDRPHPNEMSGSDLDGDMYFVCWEESLIPLCKNLPPMDFTPAKKKEVSEIITVDMIIHHIGEMIGNAQLGIIANAHLVNADGLREGIFAKNCLELAQLHSDAVDFPKTGKTVIIPHHLKPSGYPHYMTKKDKPMYTSKHVIAKLFDQCEAIEQSTTRYQKTHDNSTVTVVDEGFLELGYEKYLEAAKNMKATYERKVSQLMLMYGIEFEAELFSLKVLKTKQKRGFLQGDSYEMIEIIKKILNLIVKQVKEIFFKDVPSGKCKESLQKVSALYFVTYSQENAVPSMLSLPWIFGDLLLAVKKNRTSQDVPRRLKWKSLVSSDIVRTAWKLEHKIEVGLFEHRRTRRETFQRLLELAAEDGDVRLIAIGSSVTGFDSVNSTLDVVVDISSGRTLVSVVSRWAVQLKGNVSKEILKNMTKTIASMYLPECNLKVCFFSNRSCISKTAYIVAVAEKNKWLKPVIQVVLAWGRVTNTVGNAKTSLLSTEQLLLLFLNVISGKFTDVSTADIGKTKNQLEENQFIQDPDSAGQSLEQPQAVDKLSENVDAMTLSERDSKFQKDFQPAEVLLIFFRFFNSTQGSERDVLGSISNPLIPCPDSEERQQLLIHLKDPQCKQLVQKFQQAYHSLAYLASLQEFLHINDSSESPNICKSWKKILPRQASSVIMFSEDFVSNDIRSSSGSEQVIVRRKRFKDSSPVLELEVWGNPNALRKAEEIVQRKIAFAMMFTPGNSPVTRIVIQDSFKIIFQGLISRRDELRFETYKGNRQPSHYRINAFVPRLVTTSVDRGDDQDLELFVTYFKERAEFISQNYKPEVDGKMKSVISYGNYYCCPDSDINSDAETIELFEEMSSRRGFDDNRAHVTPDQRQRGMKGTSPSVMSSFVPTGKAELSWLKGFLKEHGFVVRKHVREYRVSIKMSLNGKRTNIECVLVLDEKFSLKTFLLPERKWLVIDTIRKQEPNSEPLTMNSIRYKLNSRPLRSDKEMQNRECKELLRNARNILNRSRDGTVKGVNIEYAERVKTVRRKSVHTFDYVGNGAYSEKDAAFLRRVAIRVNHGVEFSSPTAGGRFKRSEKRTEITATTDCPEFHDSQECDEFSRQIWKFSNDFGRHLK